MLKAALALIPLLSAYLFCHNWRRLRYRNARLDSQRFYLMLAVWAVSLGAMGLLLSIALLGCDWYGSLVFSAQSLASTVLGASLRDYYVLTFFGLAVTFCLGPIAASVLNGAEWLLREAGRLPRGYFATRSAVAKDDFDLILFRAWESAMTVSLTLTSGKVYIGFVVRAVDPDDEEKSLRILPILSGHRDSSHRLAITTNYLPITDQVLSTDEACHDVAHLDYSHFELAIVRSAILTVNIFDLAAYEHFRAQATNPTA